MTSIIEESVGRLTYNDQSTGPLFVLQADEQLTTKSSPSHPLSRPSLDGVRTRDILYRSMSNPVGPLMSTATRPGAI